MKSNDGPRFAAVLSGKSRMPVSVALAAFAFLLMADRPRAEQPDADSPATKATVELLDGSRVIGEPAGAELKMVTPVGEVSVPLLSMTQMVFDRDHKTAEVSLVNGDHLSGAVKTKTFSVKTAWGKIDLPLQQVRALTIMGHADPPPVGTWHWPHNSMLVTLHADGTVTVNSKEEDHDSKNRWHWVDKAAGRFDIDWNGLMLNKATLAPDGKTFTATNAFGDQFTASLVAPDASPLGTWTWQHDSMLVTLHADGTVTANGETEDKNSPCRWYWTDKADGEFQIYWNSDNLDSAYLGPDGKTFTVINKAGEEYTVHHPEQDGPADAGQNGKPGDNAIIIDSTPGNNGGGR